MFGLGFVEDGSIWHWLVDSGACLGLVSGLDKGRRQGFFSCACGFVRAGDRLSLPPMGLRTGWVCISPACGLAPAWTRPPRQ